MGGVTYCLIVGAWDETAEDAALKGCAGAIECGLHDGVVYGVEVEVDDVADGGLERVRRVCETTVFSNINIVNIRIRRWGGGFSGGRDCGGSGR